MPLNRDRLARIEPFLKEVYLDSGRLPGTLVRSSTRARLSIRRSRALPT
jgi:hypothetical protein